MTPVDRAYTVHPTAVIGGPPEHREWWSREARPATDSYGTYFDVRLGEDVRIGPFVTVDGGMVSETKVGARTWLMAHVHVGHDAVLGADCELAPGTVIGGHCVVGDRVRFGVNACVRPFITIGDGARVGAGAVVVKHVPAGVVVAGNPARPLKAKLVEMTQAEDDGWQEWYEKSRESISETRIFDFDEKVWPVPKL